VGVDSVKWVMNMLSKKFYVLSLIKRNVSFDEIGMRYEIFGQSENADGHFCTIKLRDFFQCLNRFYSNSLDK